MDFCNHFPSSHLKTLWLDNVPHPTIQCDLESLKLRNCTATLTIGSVLNHLALDKCRLDSVHMDTKYLETLELHNTQIGQPLVFPELQHLVIEDVVPFDFESSTKLGLVDADSLRIHPVNISTAIHHLTLVDSFVFSSHPDRFGQVELFRFELNGELNHDFDEIEELWERFWPLQLTMPCVETLYWTFPGKRFLNDIAPRLHADSFPKLKQLHLYLYSPDDELQSLELDWTPFRHAKIGTLLSVVPTTWNMSCPLTII